MLQERFVSLSSFMVFFVWEEAVCAHVRAHVCVGRTAEGGGGREPKCIDLVKTQLASELRLYGNAPQTLIILGSHKQPHTVQLSARPDSIYAHR